MTPWPNDSMTSTARCSSACCPCMWRQALHYHDTRRTLDLVRGLLDRVEAAFEEPDAGIWEFRGRLQHHCHTYLFHWAAAGRLSRSPRR